MFKTFVKIFLFTLLTQINLSFNENQSKPAPIVIVRDIESKKATPTTSQYEERMKRAMLAGAEGKAKIIL